MDIDDVIRELENLKRLVQTTNTNVAILVAKEEVRVTIDKEIKEIREDHEKRLRWIERVAYSGIGGLTVIQALHLLSNSK